MDYRFAGKRKTLAMGVYPEVSLKQARERREEARRLLAEDVDPGEYKKATRTMKSATGDIFEAVAREWFVKHSTGWAKGKVIPTKLFNVWRGMFSPGWEAVHNPCTLLSGTMEAPCTGHLWRNGLLPRKVTDWLHLLIFF